MRDLRFQYSNNSTKHPTVTKPVSPSQDGRVFLFRWLKERDELMYEELEESITEQDLQFIAEVCLRALNDLGYIDENQLKPWRIQFSDTCLETGVLGGTLPIDDHHGILISPKVTKANVLETVAHEAVHLIQWMKGDTKSGEGDSVIEWKGTPYKILPGNDPGYDNQPWEEEAYRLAPEVIDKLKHTSLTQLGLIWMGKDVGRWALELFTNKDW
jgi:hypothetical protein